MSPPLDGVVVADFSRVLAGPVATMTLADLGATVVKVERPGVGDDTRTWGPPWSAGSAGSSSSSTYFESVNRSKLSITLDLADPGDREVAVELAHRADVLVENFRPGSLDRYGLGYQQVAAANPRIVYCSVTGFGAGKGADRLGYDFVVQALGGLMSITGEKSGQPTKVGVALVDVLTGKDATIGILAALADRQRTGHGCRVEVNLLSSLLGSLVNQAQGYLENGRAPGRMGNQHPSIAPYETLRCRDGLVAVACGNDGQFARLATALGDPELAGDVRFRTNAARVEHRPALIEALERLLASADPDTWEGRLNVAGVPAGKVGDIADGFALAEKLGLDPVWPGVPGGAGQARAGEARAGQARAGQVRHAVTYSSVVVRPPGPPPSLGQDSGAVRAWLHNPTHQPLERC